MVMVNGKPELQCSYGRRTPIHHDLDYGWGSHEQVTHIQVTYDPLHMLFIYLFDDILAGDRPHLAGDINSHCWLMYSLFQYQICNKYYF